jgi:hypothetical protein
MKRIKCTNPECRNFKYTMRKDFCPKCKALTALRYIKRKEHSKKKDWIFMEKVDKPFHLPITHPVRIIFEHSFEIGKETFLKYVALEYVSILLGYKTKKSSGTIIFNDDPYYAFFRAKYKGKSIVWMHQLKNDIVYIFGPHDFVPRINFRTVRRNFLP